MTEKEYRSAIEAILFTAGDPVDIQRLALTFDLPVNAVEDQLSILMKEYAEMDRGITIIKLNNSYQMVTVKAYASWVRKAMDLRRNIPLSQAAMEVLAVIAYNQPVTKSFIEQVRGVDCSGVIGSLTTKDLIEEKGRLELPGRPLLYGTTENFLRCFNVSSLAELPPIPKDEDRNGGQQLSIFDDNAEDESDDTVSGTVEEIVEQAVAEDSGE